MRAALRCAHPSHHPTDIITVQRGIIQCSCAPRIVVAEGEEVDDASSSVSVASRDTF